MRSAIVSAAFIGLAAVSSAAPAEKRTQGRHYNGFDRIKYLFVFGDSYTTTGFNLTNGSPLPSQSNPLGNPPYPGYTSANGPNWVDYLTYQYNKSVVQTYNLAYGGATVDSALVKPYLDTVLSVKDQVEKEFLPILANPPPRSVDSALPRWKADTSLFLTWIGINDIGNSWYYQNFTLNDAILNEYFALQQKLYDAGARNFVFINVPPLLRTPLFSATATDFSIAALTAVENDYNDKLAARVTQFAADNRGTSTWFLDAEAAFNKIIDASATDDFTFSNVTGYCPAYQNGAPSWTYKDPSCEYSVDKYLWLNSLHPTYEVHKQLAKDLAAIL